MSTLLVDDILHILATGTLSVEGLLPWSSNYSFLVNVHGRSPQNDAEYELPAVYKPRSGERPLWDFPQGTLSNRERAAFLVSRDIGWNLIPPTVLRQGPNGVGSVQLFIQHDPERHYFTIEGTAVHRRQLQQLTLLDVIINNADRKGGHVLVGEVEKTDAERLWGIDHGIAFHSEYKLRTVIWEFAGSSIPADLLADLTNYCQRLAADDGGIRSALTALLSRREVSAFQRRLENTLQRQTFIHPGPGRHYPWPPV